MESPDSPKKIKSPIAIEEENKKQAQHIFEEFKDYTDGYRCLFLIHRNKEGGETNNTKYMKVISRNSKEYLEELTKLVKFKNSNHEIPYRIYTSVNERNIEKAIRQFKYEQLEADYYDQEQKENFYLDVKNRFIGCLMQHAQRKTSFFIFDVDNEEGRDVMGESLHAIPAEHIVQTYPTKNGWHIITKPFNHTVLKLPSGCSWQRDSLILLSW